ncbi:thiol-disulfide oxidoreductase DCC family protein [Pseudoluteimonas lycopersici]|uniref:Thiol-disulfide oxidoreductase DCC family protein n=1 Tax=Pseudoluteimonas lycopersici TaxID=1324796 RepID=A0A516V8L5_9GAMM|nr:thiol-disulfide oxidoreductase DCC family protein [Lysobacter lycopersici]
MVVFDGVCVACNRSVDFLLRRDRAKRYSFAAMQSPAGHALMAAHGIDPANPASFLLLEGGRAFRDSEAVLRVLSGLGGAWRCARFALFVPRAWRDAVYRGIARHRYRWFGRREACRVPTREEAGRFLS